MKTLVIYYSWSKGNTKRIADMICQLTKADKAEIRTVVPYSGLYDEVVKQGLDEVKSGFKPIICALGVDPNEYERIFIGTPTWWYTMAPAVLSFLTAHAWQGKEIALFATSGGWPGHVIKDMKKLCQGSEVIGSMEIQFDSTGGDQMISAAADVENWIRNCIDKKSKYQ